MSIFDTGNQSIRPLSPADIVTREKNKNKIHKEDIRTHLKESFDSVWNNPLFTPQQMISAWGTDCLAAFMAHYAEQQFLKAVDPSYVILEAPYNIIPQQDGSIVLGDKKS